jgi:hypothetical protein
MRKLPLPAELVRSADSSNVSTDHTACVPIRQRPLRLLNDYLRKAASGAADRTERKQEFSAIDIRRENSVANRLLVVLGNSMT